MTRTDSETAALRADMCLTWLLDGWSVYDIYMHQKRQSELEEGHKDRIEEEAWAVSKQTCYNYVYKARESLEVIKKEQRKQAYQMAMLKWQKMWRKAMSNNDLSNARLIQQQIDKLTGAHEFGAGDGAVDKCIFVLPNGTEVEI